MLRKGRSDTELSDKTLDPIVVSAATKLMAQRWITIARENVENSFRAKSQSLSDELGKVLREMKEEDDWYFGGDTRITGHDLQASGRELEVNRKTLEAEASLKLNKIRKDVDLYVASRRMEINRARRAYEGNASLTRDRLRLDIDKRQTELSKNRNMRKKELMAEEKKVKEELGTNVIE